jgi:hypothetical protein
MSRSHTPAPWYWSDNVPDFPKNHCIIVDADGFTIAEPSPMGEANARLIAAAPDLLACLFDVLDADGDLDAMDFNRYRAAITKATGETA